MLENHFIQHSCCFFREVFIQYAYFLYFHCFGSKKFKAFIFFEIITEITKINKLIKYKKKKSNYLLRFICSVLHLRQQPPVSPLQLCLRVSLREAFKIEIMRRQLAKPFHPYSRAGTDEMPRCKYEILK